MSATCFVFPLADARGSETFLSRDRKGADALLPLAMAALALSLAVPPAGAADPIVISRQPWYGVQPQSPALVPGRLSLDFALVPATSPRGSTTALLAAARLPGRFADIYGGRIEGAVNIVAINLRTGAVYRNHAERGGAVPLASVMDPDPRPAQGIARFKQIDSYFNVDLRAQLRLPEHGAKYAVFLWLDDMVSPVRVAKLPGPPPSGQEERPAAGTPAGIHFGQAQNTPDPGEGIALAGAGSRVYAAVADRARQGKLNVLALDFRTRAIGWLSFTLPKREGAFDFDAAALTGAVPGEAGPQKTFVLVGIGDILSPVLVVDRSGR